MTFMILVNPSDNSAVTLVFNSFLRGRFSFPKFRRIASLVTRVQLEAHVLAAVKSPESLENGALASTVFTCRPRSKWFQRLTFNAAVQLAT